MKFWDFFKAWLTLYFVIASGIFFVRAVYTMIFYPEYVLTNQAVLHTFVLALVASLPSFILFSNNEDSIFNAKARLITHFVVLEGVMLLLGGWLEWYETFAQALGIALMVLVVYAITMGISWLNMIKTADDINKVIEKRNNDADKIDQKGNRE